MKLINCKNISLGYDGKEILNDITFGIDEGDYLCIVGENGSGKSTLLKGILGLIKPYKGSILYTITKIFVCFAVSMFLFGIINILGIFRWVVQRSFIFWIVVLQIRAVWMTAFSFVLNMCFWLFKGQIYKKFVTVWIVKLIICIFFAKMQNNSWQVRSK